ncbi:hypothetical protein GGR28_002106 [Lewinella aquimaris]|uniref:Dihydrolipoamide dehydrogenase n=1 Tax=Neolewinella aquimaris TaxID=1835722 RepID=A0A840E2P0_9BACT|nr:DUF2911 domain-containing protein [Neolewinella aquimaris]MBB4079481.1 hypothetical protein [Neolewinella aquimaris]
MQLRILTLCLLLCGTGLQAQIQSPPASPAVKMETTVGLTDVKIEYSRPGMKERTIFAADGLVPYGEIWRTGANQATKITFGDAVTVAGKEVPAGSYAILSKPAMDSWEVMFFPYETGDWTSYVEKTPAVTVTGKPTKLSEAVETFTINLGNYTLDGADLVMMWDKTHVALPITTNVKESVMATIDRVMAGPSVNDYFQAASFLNDSGADNEKALEYIRKANEMSGENARFWMVRREAIILSDLGMKQEAIEAAKRSKMLAEEAGNMDYVRMNEQSIEEWSK